MPSRKTPTPPERATLRQLRTTEAHLAHHTERSRTCTNFTNEVERITRSGLSADAMRAELQQALSEQSMAHRVAQRHLQLALQAIQAGRFPDEDAD